MNGVKGKTCYGFDVYEPAIHIPLITPRIDQYSEIDFPTSNIQLMQIILENKIEKNRYIVCDTQYYAQPYRKTAIISDKYKYIYNKLTRKEELYDLEYDPNENINLLEKLLYDQDRKRKVNAEQVIFYPYRECADLAYVDMKAYLMSFWREASKPIEIKNYLHWKLSSYKAALKRILSK